MQSPDLMECTLSPSHVADRASGPKDYFPPKPAAPASNTIRAQGNTSRTNLFIRYLPKEVDDEELLLLFQPFGPIATSMVMRDIHTGESQGVAFVRYEFPRDAEFAKRSMDQFHLYNKKLSIQWARREHDFKTANNDLNKKHMYKLFLRNVPLSATTDDLGRLLSIYGTVITVSIHADTQQAEMLAENSNYARSVSPANSAEVDGKPTTPVAAMTRRIAFVTFAEEGAAERALKGVHNTCPFPDCDGIPFMGKLINDNLLSKKQQQHQQFYSNAAGPAGGSPHCYTPRAMSNTSAQNLSLPSPASSQNRFTASLSHQSFGRSPTASQGNISASDYPSYDAALYPPLPAGVQGYVQPQPQPFLTPGGSCGNSPGAEGFYPAYSGSVTPMSESNSMTPYLRPNNASIEEKGANSSSNNACGLYNSNQRPVSGVNDSPAKRGPPPPLLQANLTTGIAGMASSNSPASTSPTSSTPSRTRRYTHNPYAALVIQ